MRRPKLTKRQEEVIRQLCSAHGRRLVEGKGGYFVIVDADGLPATGLRGVAGIVVDALRRRHSLLEVDLPAQAYVPSADAWAAFGPGSRR